MTASAVQGWQEWRGPGWHARMWQWLRSFAARKPLGAASGVMFAAVILGAVFAGVAAPSPWDLVDNSIRLQGPGFAHPLGTDQFGRDVLARVLRGARISLRVGLGATIIGVGAATLIGTLSGYAGGMVDFVVQRFVDTVQAIPPIILLIAIVVVLGPSLTNVTLALAFRTAFVSSRVVRSAVIGVRGHQYIEAARAVGCSHQRTIVRYILPNVAAPIIVIATLNFGVSILAETALSFLGYGVPPPEPSWGGMLSGTNRSFMVTAPWMLWGPALAVAWTVFAVNMLGDALRDVLDPRMRGT